MKRFITLFLAISFITILSGCGTNYEKVYSNAINDFNSGNYEAAKKQFQSIIDDSNDESLKKQAKTELENYEQKVEEHQKYVEELKRKEIEATKQRVEQEKQEKAKTQQRMNEMAKDYNTVLSNTLPALYDGCTVGANCEYVIVYITPQWYSLNEGYKQAFVDKTMRIYLGMLGARKISINTDHLSFYIKDPNTKQTLASWGSIRGIHIEE